MLRIYGFSGTRLIRKQESDVDRAGIDRVCRIKTVLIKVPG